MKLVDLGLSCYIGGTPIVPCRATGSYLPLEWRIKGNKDDPTFDRVRDPGLLQLGELYAMCVTFSKLLKHLDVDWAKRNRNYARLLSAIQFGKADNKMTRASVSMRTFINLANELLSELNTIMCPIAEGIKMLLH
jgi:hypothetical protein